MGIRIKGSRAFAYVRKVTNPKPTLIILRFRAGGSPACNMAGVLAGTSLTARGLAMGRNIPGVTAVGLDGRRDGGRVCSGGLAANGGTAFERDGRAEVVTRFLDNRIGGFLYLLGKVLRRAGAVNGAA